MKRAEKYIERNDLKDATHLEVAVYYNKGGANFYGTVSPRGYYLAVKPVTKNGMMIGHVLFSGQSRFLFDAKRFSSKQFDRAMEMAKEYEEELIAAVVEANKSA